MNKKKGMGKGVLLGFLPIWRKEVYTGTDGPRLAVVDMQGKRIATIKFNSWEDKDEARANLIAAAPELLAMLKQTAEHLREQVKQANSSYHPSEAVLMEIDEVIKKAEKES